MIKLILVEPDWYRHVTVNHAAVGSSPTTRAKYGPLAQWKSNSFTRRRSAVQPCHGLPLKSYRCPLHLLCDEIGTML